MSPNLPDLTRLVPLLDAAVSPEPTPQQIEEGWRMRAPSLVPFAVEVALLVQRVVEGDVVRAVRQMPGYAEGALEMHVFNRLPDGTLVDLTNADAHRDDLTPGVLLSEAWPWQPDTEPDFDQSRADWLRLRVAQADADRAAAVAAAAEVDDDEE